MFKPTFFPSVYPKNNKAILFEENTRFVLRAQNIVSILVFRGKEYFLN